MSVHYASLPYQTFRTGTTGEIVATQKLIATGGEGAIYTLLGDQTRVAKIYRTDKRTTRQERKLQVMLDHAPTDAIRRLVPPHISLAWPIELLYDPGGSMAGFLMPRISPRFPQIWQIYSPPNRRQKYPNITWKYLHHLALNLAVSFHSLHALDYVIGDVNAGTILVDEDPLQSCYQWARQNGHLPMPVLLPQEVPNADLDASKYLLVDTEGRPKLEDLAELINSSRWTLIPCGTSGLEIDGTLRLISALRSTETTLEKVKVVITKAPPVGTVGQQARDALREAGIPVATSVVRSYVAHQKAAELGVLVKDVPDPRAAQAWSDMLELAMEVVG